MTARGCEVHDAVVALWEPMADDLSSELSVENIQRTHRLLLGLAS